MIRFNVGTKLWLAFVGTITVCVLALYLLLHSSLRAGFLDYTSQQSVQRLEILRSALSNIYQEEDSFKTFASAPSRWLNLKEIIFSETDKLFANTASMQDMGTPTPQAYYQLNMVSPQMDRYKLMVEVNRSYDFNEFYNKTRFPDDAVYSGTGSSGQPSLVYQSVVDSDQPAHYLFNLVGHGHHSGKNGDLYTDLDNITTAKDIMEFIVAKLE